MKYKPSFVRVPPPKLTKEILKNLGFKKAEQNGKEVWRIKIPYYHHHIQIELGEYPRTNPNCGTVCIWSPKEKVPTFTKKGKKKMITLHESTIGIAWYVDTPERLRSIIVSLTQQNI